MAKEYLDPFREEDPAESTVPTVCPVGPLDRKGSRIDREDG
jgi:hypothetical protein